MELSQHYHIALVKIKENDFGAAIESLSLAIEEHQHVEYYAERAVCYIHTDQLDLSMFDMNKAIDLEPDYAYRYSCRAFLKGKMGDPKGAVEDYEKALELDPSDPIVYNNLGLAMENLGYWEKAQENFKKSNELIGYDPDNRVIENGIAVNKEDAEQPAVKREEFGNQNSEQDTTSKSQIVKDVFSKKSAFKDFIRFIGNGFKLKDDDEGGEG